VDRNERDVRLTLPLQKPGEMKLQKAWVEFPARLATQPLWATLDLRPTPPDATRGQVRWGRLCVCDLVQYFLPTMTAEPCSPTLLAALWLLSGPLQDCSPCPASQRMNIVLSS